IDLAGEANSPNPADEVAGFSFAWSITKNGANFAAGMGQSFQFTPDDNGSYVVSLTTTNQDGASDSQSQSISVSNVVPVPTITGSDPRGLEGSQISLGSTVTDSSPLDQAAGFIYHWNVTKNGLPFATGTEASFDFLPDDN